MTGQLTVQFAQEFLDKNFAPWIIDLKPKLIDCASGTARIDIPITPHIERVGRIVCGQAMSALSDTTMVFACFSHMDKLIPVATTTLDTQFLRPASGEALSCIARVERAGKALFFLSAKLVTLPSEKIVAKSTATFYLPPK
tara:strand:+ start:92 stop:514 length:423 start_codon:yes stop_codon:yes gene_type:complete